MFKSLYRKLAAILFTLLCIAAVLNVGLIWWANQFYLREGLQKLNEHVAEHVVEKNIMFKGGGINQPALKEAFHMLMVVNPSLELYLLDQDGSILTYEAPADKVRRSQVDLKPIESFINKKGRYPILGDDPRDAGGKKVFSAAPIEFDQKVEGYIYIILGGEEYDSIAATLENSYILRLSFVGLGIGLIGTLVMGLFLFRNVTQRLNALTQRMADYQNISINKKSDQQDEISMLQTVFEQMTVQIEKNIQKIKQAEHSRRELTTNISHDLKTPLTSLQGYIETLILKKETLSAKEELDYLTIARKHCERLEYLIDDLFEHARLGSNELRLNRETCSMTELLDDIVQKFQHTAQQKLIMLSTQFDANIPNVSIDIGMTERVFENLIKNALRHTNINGSITIKGRSVDEGVEIQVIDTGVGIAPQDLSNVFDRSFSRRNDGVQDTEESGSGLGLCIAQKIMELHGGSISVTSEVGLGSIFRLKWPVEAELLTSRY